MISDGSGNAIIVWSDQEIHAQKVNSEMDLLWGDDGVVVTAADGWQQRAEICGDGAGNAFVAWVDYRGWAEERTDEDIYAQKVDRDGNALWTVDGVPVCAGTDTQRNPMLALDGAGGVYAAWESYHEGYDVYVNRLDAGGSIQWGAEGVLLNTLCSSRWDPHLAAVDGGVVVAWTDFRNVDDDLGRDIFADFVSAGGVKR